MLQLKLNQMCACLLLQVHTVAELQRVLQLKLDGCMLGINNRDLGTFKVDLHNNKDIMDSAAGQQVSSCRTPASLAELQTPVPV